MKILEETKKSLLEKEEAKWMLKSRAIWLIEGDGYTHIYQNYDKHRKNINIIWEMSTLECTREISFSKIVEEGRRHFKSFFRSQTRPICLF